MHHPQKSECRQNSPKINTCRGFRGLLVLFLGCCRVFVFVWFCKWVIFWGNNTMPTHAYKYILNQKKQTIGIKYIQPLHPVYPQRPPWPGGDEVVVGGRVVGSREPARGRTVFQRAGAKPLGAYGNRGKCMLPFWVSSKIILHGLF